MAEGSFTGLTRGRKTPPRVRRAEVISRLFITAGGIGTILAVVLIFAFLVWVVFPLFAGAEAVPAGTVSLPDALPEASVLAGGLDESRLQLWTITADGRVQVRQASDGALLVDRSVTADGAVPTAWSFAPAGGGVAFGYADGTVRTGRLSFETRYLEREDVPAPIRGLPPGGFRPFAEGVLAVTTLGQWRYDQLVIDLGEPVRITASGIRLLDYSITPGGTAFGFLSVEGRLGISSISERLNIMTDTVEQDVTEKTLVYEALPERGEPAFLRLSGIGNTLYLAWRDGHLQRYDARDAVLQMGLTMSVVERIDLLPDSARTLDHLVYLNGKTTLLAADSSGTVSGWFPSRPPGAFPRDGTVLTRAHVLPGPDVAVTSIATSPRTRLIAVGYANGVVRFYQVTSDALLAEVSSRQSAPFAALFLAPKEDALVGLRQDAFETWNVEVGHPEAGRALFSKVWYEGDVEPTHVWQSAGGSDEFEPKLSLVPLIFGTLKATLYSILIGAPIALLAALFTSEFLHPRLRSPIKSTVEMMASLPSVVLGFIAAIVIAPFVRDVLATTLCTFLTLPLTILLAARLWQFLPTRTAIRLAGWPRLLAMAAVLPAAIGIASLLSPHVVNWCFGGDLEGWLSGQVGTAAGGWSFLLLPVALLVVAFSAAWLGGPWLRRVSLGWGPAGCAAIDLARFACVLVAAVGLAWLLGQALGGADPRGGIVGPYQPRNAMIVGFVMGFAIVPIIYTLSEDALTSVPSELREGSLGCGATPWQTAVRIVLPTATSGLFGALMVGLGRAVGETMIVLMAAGNTPLMEWSVFNGFRTLSANIATELPEAVRDSTHYRILFLAGLVLFAITFLINTVAEMVRRRVRKRYAQL